MSEARPGQNSALSGGGKGALDVDDETRVVQMPDPEVTSRPLSLRPWTLDLENQPTTWNSPFEFTWIVTPCGPIAMFLVKLFQAGSAFSTQFDILNE
jgi:hypothetical protein